jgi:hypothetical protein
MKKVSSKEAVLKKESKPQQESQQEVKVLKLNVQDAQNFIAIMGVILVNYKETLKSLETHFVDMIKRNNETNTEQPVK